MITGRQIREARTMLKWDRDILCLRADVTEDIARRAEEANGTPSITLHQAARIKQAFERAGIRFGQGGGMLMIVAKEQSSPSQT